VQGEGCEWARVSEDRREGERYALIIRITHMQDLLAGEHVPAARTARVPSVSPLEETQSREDALGLTT
jgi:hypothetical protein